mmetsp:Transcript_17996/g.29875  ORF Transcript_17996/g.29875 Transcript_17996/m.29875 type:complete len:115 (+) Transcript_17996:467-811(+)
MFEADLRGRSLAIGRFLLQLHTAPSAWSSNTENCVLVSGTFGAPAEEGDSGCPREEDGRQDNREGELGHFQVFLASGFERMVAKEQLTTDWPWRMAATTSADEVEPSESSCLRF